METRNLTPVFLYLDKSFSKNRGIDDLLSTSKLVNNFELLNPFSELDPILFSIECSIPPFLQSLTEESSTPWNLRTDKKSLAK
jgi:hypothetical protein